MLRDQEAIQYRQRAYREAYGRLGTIRAAAAELGVSAQTIAYAVNPEFAAKKRANLRKRYYLKTILPRKLEAESRGLV